MKAYLKLTSLAFVALTIAIGVQSEPYSFIEYIPFELFEDYFFCGRTICSGRTFGCRLQLKNNPANHSEVINKVECYLENNTPITTLTEKEDNKNQIDVDIDVRAYRGAESAYRLNYDLHTQRIQGVVNPETGWKAVKKEARNRLNAAEKEAKNTSNT